MQYAKKNEIFLDRYVVKNKTKSNSEKKVKVKKAKVNKNKNKIKHVAIIGSVSQ